MTAALALYRGLTTAGLPLFLRLLSRRVKRGREDAARLGERMGQAGAPRPEVMGIPSSGTSGSARMARCPSIRSRPA